MPLEKNEIVALNFSDFTGGINLSGAPQKLQDNEYQSLKNFEHDFNRLTTRGGSFAPLGTFPSNIKKAFYDESTHVMQVFLGNGDICEEDLSTPHNNGTLGGKVTVSWAGKTLDYTIKNVRRGLNVFSVCRDGVFKITTTSKIILDYLKVYLFEK